MTKNKIIYLDNAATTMLAPEVIAAMTGSFTDCWANASSDHPLGREVNNKLTHAVENIARFMKISMDELILTSGATESINQALKGVMHAQKKKHLITSTIEHKATLQTVQTLVKQGFKATFLKPDSNGLITPEMIKTAITAETALISLLWVNNETGMINDIPAISKIARAHNVLLHIDATQAIPHFEIDVTLADLLSFTAHKCYGPKGIGALYKRNFPKIPMVSLIDGGKTVLGNHVGTLANHQIIGFSTALDLLNGRYIDEYKINQNRADYLLNTLKEFGVTRNGERQNCMPAIINLHIPTIMADTLRAALPHICMAKGSACTSDETLPSHVLTEMGYSTVHAHQSVRISLSRYLEEEAFKGAVRDLKIAIGELQKFALGEKTSYTLLHFYDDQKQYQPDLLENAPFTVTHKYTLNDDLFSLKLMINKGNKIDHINAYVMATPFILWAMDRSIKVLRGKSPTDFIAFKFSDQILGGDIPTSMLRLLMKIEAWIHQIGRELA